MHPELIKAQIRIAGTTPAAVAAELGVTRNTVSHVIHGRGISLRVAARISELIDRPLGELWPGRYPEPKRIGKRASAAKGVSK